MSSKRYSSSTYGDNDSLGQEGLQHLNNNGNVSQYKQIRKSSSTYFDNMNPYGKKHKTKGVILDQQRWQQLSKDAVYYYGIDLLFGKMVCMIFRNPETLKFGSLIISRHGSTKFESMSLKPDSKYYPAVKNLPKEMQNDNIRKILAISILRLYATLDDTTHDYLLKTSRLTPDFDYDETIAGEVASRMKIINNQSPKDIGSLLLSMGYTEPHKIINSNVVDVVYHNRLKGEQEESERLIDENNELAFLLGQQLEHLFDPLTEYSPEPTEKVYRPPQSSPSTNDNSDNILVKNICLELIKVQTNFTISLVTFLQKFLVPLRFRVMEGKVKNFSTAKLNIIFPPTIDEITRMNCIFLDVLNLAAPYGSFEILKACGTTIPYFYKAYMRHEAATKNIHSQLEEFFKECKENNIQIYETDIVYDRSSIESIINSSPNLTKIQLIINRLMETQNWKPEKLTEVTNYFNSCLDTISSFGNDNLKPYTNRIFTPTGKLLTEFASDWPAQLQFGWLTRRLVAVFDVRNVTSRSVKDMYVLIVFSDHILLLEIDDDSYYVEQYTESENSIYRPSVADCLMHSLVNEVPVSKIPNMKVVAWSSVKDAIASHHGFGSNSFLNLYFLGEEFGEYSSYVFEVLQANIDYVIDVFNRAKILNKSQPFHLFKSSVDNFCSYYTAHEEDSYEEEEVKSPIVIYLNSEVNTGVLVDRNLFGAISLSFCDSGVEVRALTQGNINIDVVQSKEYLHIFLADVIRQMVIEYISLGNILLMPFFIKNNDVLLSEVLFTLSVTPKQKQRELQSISKRVTALRKEIEEQQENEHVQVTKSRSRANSLNALSNKRQPSTRIHKSKAEGKPKSLVSKKKSTNNPGFFARLFQRKKQFEAQDSSNGEQTPKKQSVSKKRLSQLFLSGEKDIVVPSPIKKKVEPQTPVQLTKSESGNKNHLTEINDNTIDGLNTNNNTTTASSSIIVNSHFAFPATGGQEVDYKDQQSVSTLNNKSTMLRGLSSDTLGDILKVDISNSTFAGSLSGFGDLDDQQPVKVKRLDDQKTTSSGFAFKKPRTPPTSQLFTAIGNLMGAKENTPKVSTKTNGSNFEVSENLTSTQKMRPKADDVSPLQEEKDYFSNFRQAAITQQKQINQQQRTVAQPEDNPLHASSKSVGRGYPTPTTKEPVISSRKLETVEIIRDNKNGIWPVNDTPPLKTALLYSPSVTKKLNNLFNEMHIRDIPEDDEDEENWKIIASRTNTEIDISKMAGNDKAMYSKPVMKEPQVESPMTPNPEVFYTPKEAPVDMFGSLDFGNFSVDIPDLTIANECDDDVDSDAHSVSTAIENDFFTPLEHQEPQFKSITVVEHMPTKKVEPRHLNDDLNDKGDTTSLCSALKDIRDTTEGAILVHALEGKKLYSETSLDDYLDGSFDYLGEFLYGDITLNSNYEPVKKSVPIQTKPDPSSQYTDHDKVFAESLRDSSLNYLASFIRSGKTEKNLQSLLNAN